MIAAYIRVSSAAQSLTLQREEIARVARDRGDAIARWFGERASVTRVGARRPQLDRVFELARAGELERLYVYRIDRLTRTGIRDTLVQLNNLVELGVDVVSAADPFPLQGPGSELTIALFAWAAQMEGQIVGDRVAAARRVRAAAGLPWGKPPSLDAKKIESIHRARRKLVDGRPTSIRAIATELGISRSVVGRVLSQQYAPASSPRDPLIRRRKRLEKIRGRSASR